MAVQTMSIDECYVTKVWYAIKGMLCILMNFVLLPLLQVGPPQVKQNHRRERWNVFVVTEGITCEMYVT